MIKFIVRVYVLIMIPTILTSFLFTGCATKEHTDRKVRPEITDEHFKLFALALPGVVVQYNYETFDELRPYTDDEEGKTRAANILNNIWDINSSWDVFNKINRLKNSGLSENCGLFLTILKKNPEMDIKTIQSKYNLTDLQIKRLKFTKTYEHHLDKERLLRGYDLAICIAISRWAHQMGYISEQVAWDYINPCAEKILELFDSWEEFGTNYILGGMTYSAGDNKSLKWKEYESASVFYRLLDPELGQWSKIKWPGQPVTANNYPFLEQYKNLADFFIALEKDDIETVIKLTSSYDFRNKVDMHFRSPVFLSLISESEKSAELLIKKGFSVNKVYHYNKRTPIMSALIKNNTRLIHMLLNSGAEINISDNNGWTPLMFAVKHSTQEIVQLLTESGAKVNVVNKDGYTPLMFASKYGLIEISQVLIDTGSDINIADHEGWTPLMSSLRYGTKDVSHMLLKAGANVNTANNYGWTPLMFALHYGTKDTVQMLIEAGADVNIADHEGWTPLMTSLRYSTEDTSQLLLNAGAEVNAANDIGWTPLLLALRYQTMGISDILIDNRASVNAKNKNGWTPLMLAIANNKTASIQKMIGFGAKINTRNNSKNTALHLSVEKNLIQVTELLLKNGADQNLKNKRKRTPIFHAVKNENLEMLRLLFKYHADPNIVDDTGDTPFINAFEENAVDIQEVLLQNHADPNVSSSYGLRPIYNTISNNLMDSFKLLLTYGADLNFVQPIKKKSNKTFSIGTPLHLSVLLDKEEMTLMLLQAGAAPNIRNSAGFIPLHYAVQHNKEKITRILMQYGSNPYIDPIIEKNKNYTPLKSAQTRGYKNIESILLTEKQIFNNARTDKPNDKSYLISENWFKMRKGRRVTSTHNEAHSGRNSLLISTPIIIRNISYWGQTITNNLPYGKYVSAKCYIKTDNLEGTGVSLALRADTSGKPKGDAEYYQTTQTLERIVGTNDWTEYTIGFNSPLSDDIKSLTVYLIMQGSTTGFAYFDDIELIVE